MKKVHRLSCYFRHLLGYALLLMTSSGCSIERSDHDAESLPIQERSQIDGETSTVDTESMVRGVITDPQGQPLIDVHVTVDGEATLTDQHGRYALKRAPGTGLIVNIARSGYMTRTERVSIFEGKPSILNLTLRERSAAQPLDAALGGVVEGEGGAAIKAGPNAFVSMDGTPITGLIDVSITLIDPSDPEHLASAPGEFIGVTRDDSMVAIESFGMIDVVLSQDGHRVQVREGATVEIKIPAAQRAVNPPRETPLWYFDEDRGVWIEDGAATWNEEQGVYQGTVTHFTAWNIDVPYETACISGIVLDATTMAPLAGARVDAVGLGYFAASATTTDADGRFYLIVRVASDVRVTAYHSQAGSGAVSRDLTSSGTTVTLPIVPSAHPSCLDGGVWQVTADQYRGADGTQYLCDIMPTWFESTCLERAATEMRSCFDPVIGSCPEITYGTPQSPMITRTWANGARTEVISSEMTRTIRYINSTGVECSRIERSRSGDSETALLSFDSGMSFTITSDELGGDHVDCGDGDLIELDETRYQVLNACVGSFSGEDAQGICDDPNTTSSSSATSPANTAAPNTGMPCVNDAACGDAQLTCCDVQMDRSEPSTMICLAIDQCDLLDDLRNDRPVHSGCTDDSECPLNTVCLVCADPDDGVVSFGMCAPPTLTCDAP